MYTTTATSSCCLPRVSTRLTWARCHFKRAPFATSLVFTSITVPTVTRWANSNNCFAVGLTGVFFFFVLLDPAEEEEEEEEELLLLLLLLLLLPPSVPLLRGLDIHTTVS